MDKDRIIVFVSVITIFFFMGCGYLVTQTIHSGMTDNMFDYGYSDGYNEHNKSTCLKYQNYTQTAWGTDYFNSASMEYSDGYVKGYNKWNKTNN